MTSTDTDQRAAWDTFEACCDGLLAQQCRYHAPYMGCPLDCTDVENAIGEEWKAARPIVVEMFGEIERLRAENDLLRNNVVTLAKVIRDHLPHGGEPGDADAWSAALALIETLRAEKVDLARILGEQQRVSIHASTRLTAEEREALTFARRVLDTSGMFRHQMHDPTVNSHVSRCQEAVAVLDKLISSAATEGK